MLLTIRRAGLVLSVMLGVLAIVTGYWQVVQGSALAAREDNPRLVIAERRVPRGAILDRSGQPLAVSQRVSGNYERYYPEPAAAPIVGYYSLRHGLGGVEAAFDDELRGVMGQTRLDALVNRWLHRVPPGHSVRLTLDMAVQRAADAALGDRTGAVVVLSVPEGEVIALASRPTFDPARLDQDWEQLRAEPSSPLLNRATQGAYQPGAAFQSIILAEALSKGIAHLTDTMASETAPLAVVDGKRLDCVERPLDHTLAAWFAAACPSEFAASVSRLDAQDVAEAIRRWQLDAPVDSFELPHHSPGSWTDMLTTTQAVREMILGQGALTVSPLRMAFVIGTLANGGYEIAPPHLTFKPVSSGQPIVSSQVASAIRSALRTRGDLAGQVAYAISGEELLVWFVGFAPAQSPRWAIVVLLENGDAESGWQIAVAAQSKLPP